MIKIEISADNPLEAFAQAAVYGVRLLQIPDVSEAMDLVTNMEKHWMAKKEKETADVHVMGKPISKSTAPAVPPECDTLPPEPDAALSAPADEKPTAKVPTAEEVRAAGIAAGQKHGNAKVKAILKEMGVAKMSELAEGDRAAFLQKLESLGDGNA